VLSVAQAPNLFDSTLNADPLEGVTGVYSGLKSEDELRTTRCDDALQPGSVG
jgi:hypothetical protein